MAYNDDYEDEGTLVTDANDAGTLALLNKSEIDQQIATAKKYPRSIRRFRDECLSMVTLSEKVASECIYALPRDGKTIEGPSARFAEVVASAWGNCRAGARVISEDGDFVTAQGAFYDLERNVAIQYEVQRRITDRKGNRFKADMIGVTANAACSIALRNAILKGVPKAFWSDMYDEARKASVGDVRSLVNKRQDALNAFQKMHVTPEMIFSTLGINGIEDIDIEALATLKGLYTALRDGETTVEQAFGSSKSTDSLSKEIKRPSELTKESDPMEEARKAQAKLEEARSVSPKPEPMEHVTAAASPAPTSPQEEPGSKTSSGARPPEGIELSFK